METYTREKVSLQKLLLEKPSQTNGATYKDCDDTDSYNMGSENRFLKRTTLYGRTSFIRSTSMARNSYSEIEPAQLQPAKTLRQSLYRRKQDVQELPSQSEKSCSYHDSQKQASDKQWHVTSWLQKMRPSLYKRKENAILSEDSARLMATSRSPMIRDYRSLSDHSENEHGNHQASSQRYQQINAMYWSTKINDELSTQLLTKKSATATDYENQ